MNLIDVWKSKVLNKFKYDLLKCKNSFIIIHDELLTDSAETAKQHSELGIFQLNCRNSFRTLRVGQAFLFVNMKTYLRSHPSRLKDVMVILSLRSVVARKTMLCNTRLLPEKYRYIRYFLLKEVNHLFLVVFVKELAIHSVLEWIWIKGSYLSQWLPQGERGPPKESKSRWIEIFHSGSH